MISREKLLKNYLHTWWKVEPCLSPASNKETFPPNHSAVTQWLVGWLVG